MKKSEVNQFTRKLYKLFNSGIEIEFQKMPKHRGLIWIEESPMVIQLDPSQEIIPTLIHETCHALYPRLKEAEILEKERRLMDALTDRQIKNILKRLVRIL